MKKLDVVVLAGGLSNERAVSLSSGSQIANALMANGHRVILIDVFDGITDASDFETAYAKYHQDHFKFNLDEQIPEIEPAAKETQDLVGPNVINICKTAAITCLALHGGIGEDGRLQALFDIHHIRYTGSGFQGSLLAMDKELSKVLMRGEGILTPAWRRFKKGDDPTAITLPVVIKPNDNGSSVGITAVETKAQLNDALQEALAYSETVLVEEKIQGREFSVALLAGKALPVIEINPQGGFYDYRHKYQAGLTQEETPAHLSAALTEEMQSIAEAVYTVLGLQVYGRVDFLLDALHQIYVIEANSLPGMTPTSLMPQEAAVIGLDYAGLCERILQESLQKYR